MMGVVLPKMPDAATNTCFPSTHPSPLDFSTADNMKMHLQHLLDSKGKQLQQAGSLEQCILAQQKKLEEWIMQIQDAMEGEGNGEEIQELYKQLVDMQLFWDEENARLSSAFGSSAKVYSLASLLCFTSILILFSVFFEQYISFTHPA